MIEAIMSILQKPLSTATESVMSTNKSSDEYAHDIDIRWGEAESRQNKYSSDSDEEMQSGASSRF